MFSLIPYTIQDRVNYSAILTLCFVSAHLKEEYFVSAKVGLGTYWVDKLNGGCFTAVHKHSPIASGWAGGTSIHCIVLQYTLIYPSLHQ